MDAKQSKHTNSKIALVKWPKIDNLNYLAGVKKVIWVNVRFFENSYRNFVGT